MVEWARRIDGARYDSVEEAVLGDDPALRFLVESLRSKSLAEVAASQHVAKNYQSVRRALLSGQRLFRKASRIENDGIVVFHVEDMGKALLSRYAPYLDYPKARYSVGIMDTGHGTKITAMRNPWRRFRSVPLGKIFSQYGGGGHQRVASVLLKDTQEAKRTLGSILSDLRRASATGSSLRKETVSGD